MDTPPETLTDAPEPPSLRFLRRLVTVLTGAMICGVILIVALIVIRLRDNGPTVPEELTLPRGVTARAVTFGTGWVAIVTDDDRILIYNRLTGALTQDVAITGR